MTQANQNRPSMLAIATNPAVMRRAAKIALVVGTILMAINHGDSIIMGQMTLVSWLKCALTFLVPYCVSTATAIMAARDTAA